MKKRRLLNTEIAKSVWEAIGKGDLYPTINSILDEIDIGRTPQQEEMLFAEEEILEIIQDYIYGFECKIEEHEMQLKDRREEVESETLTEENFVDRLGIFGKGLRRLADKYGMEVFISKEIMHLVCFDELRPEKVLPIVEESMETAFYEEPGKGSGTIMEIKQDGIGYLVASWGKFTAIYLKTEIDKVLYLMKNKG